MWSGLIMVLLVLPCSCNNIGEQKLWLLSQVIFKTAFCISQRPLSQTRSNLCEKNIKTFNVWCLDFQHQIEKIYKFIICLLSVFYLNIVPGDFV